MTGMTGIRRMTRKTALDLLPQEQIYLATKLPPFARRPIQVAVALVEIGLENHWAGQITAGTTKSLAPPAGSSHAEAGQGQTRFRP